MALSKRLRFKILRRDGYACQYCGAKAAVELHVDHVIARACGGTDDPANLKAACADCNLGKATLDGRENETLVAQLVAHSDHAVDHLARNCWPHFQQPARIVEWRTLEAYLDSWMFTATPGLSTMEA